MTFWPGEKIDEEDKPQRDEYVDYIFYLRRKGHFKDKYKSKADIQKREQELMDLENKLLESGQLSSYGTDDEIDYAVDSEEQPVAVVGEKPSLEDTSSDDELRGDARLADTSSDDEVQGDTRLEDTSSDDEVRGDARLEDMPSDDETGEKTRPESDDDIGEKQVSLSDTPAAVSEEKLLLDKKRKSIVLSLGHISTKDKKMKIDQDIGVPSNVIALVTRVFDEKMTAFEKVLKTMESILLSCDDEIGEKTSAEDTSSDDDIGGKQGLLSDTPAAASEEKLKSIVLSLGHISMKNKKMKVDENIGVAFQDKVIALATRVIDEKMASFENILDTMERILMLHMTASWFSDIVSSDDLSTC